jgi:hypothetical protein
MGQQDLKFGTSVPPREDEGAIFRQLDPKNNSRINHRENREAGP